MDTINESEAFSHGAFTDKKETGSVTVKGKTVTISWQAIVNDDLGAITRIPEIVGASFRAKQNRDVYYALYGTGTGPTMTELDSGSATACFTALRGNYASGAGAPSVSTLATARKAMRLMSAPKGEGSDIARPLNLVPSFIIAGAALEQTIETLLMSQNGYTAIDPAGTNLNTYNPFGNGGRTSLQMIIDPVIDGKTTTGWWLAASPSQIETICILALNGQLMPTIRSEESRVGEALGINWDIYGAYGVMCGDHRGLYFHAGA
jgi:hypothetical protein